MCFLSSFLTVTHRSTESQRQPELSSIEFGESLNDADTIGQRAMMMKNKMDEQEEITKNKKSLTNLAHACDRYNITDKVGAAVT